MNKTVQRYKVGTVTTLHVPRNLSRNTLTNKMRERRTGREEMVGPPGRTAERSKKRNRMCAEN